VGRYFVCWVVTCKNHIYHVPLNFIYKHKIPLAEADAVTSRPPINGPFRVRCDMCGKGYVYKPSEVLRIEKELPEGFADRERRKSRRSPLAAVPYVMTSKDSKVKSGSLFWSLHSMH
jgi:hypothetical protein